MPPRKNCEKSQLKTVELKPERGVRKRATIKKPVMGGKIKIPSSDNPTTTANGTLDPEDAPQNTTKTKLSRIVNNININGTLIKPTKNNKVTNDESNNPDCVTTKIKRTKAAGKQNQNEKKITPLEEATEERCTTEEVPLIVRKVKSVNKESMKKDKLICAKKATTRGPKLKAAPPKVKSAHSSLKLAQKECKVTLANEVIRSAFQKKQNINPTTRSIRMKKPSVKMNSGESINQPTKVLEGHDHIPDVAKKKAVKRTNRKRAAPLKLEEDPQHLNNVTPDQPVEEEIPIKRRKLSLKRNTLKKTVNKNTVVEGKAEIKESESAANGASPLNSNDPPACDNKSGTQSQKPNNVSCRKNSGASTSTVFSWTKDISSSSTTTCITVKSSDFLRIDNKLPIVKLTNVENRVKGKDSNDNIFEENSNDSPLQTPGSTARSSSDIADLNVSQTLNLSTSSLTSVVTHTSGKKNNDIERVNNDVIMDKLKQSLENLSSKMKNFDVEMINWIGYENESQDDNRRNISTHVFKLFREENEVIRYCKEMKRVLVGDKYDQCSEVIEERTNDIEETPPEPNDNSTENEQAKDVTENSDKDKGVTVEGDSESKKNEGTELDPDPDREEKFNNSKSFDKEVDPQDNDDDDALSLYAESITGLESFRKSCYFSTPRSNDESITQPNLRESFGQTDRLSVSNNVDETENPINNQVKHNVERQRADSSSVLNRTSEVISKCQVNNSRPVCDRISDRFKVQNLGANLTNSFSDIQNVISTDTVDFKRRVTEFPSPKFRSVGDTSENVSNRSSEFQNNTSRTFENISNSVNDSEDFSAKSFENWNKRTLDTEFNTDEESFGGDRNFAIPSIDQFKQATIQPFGIANKHPVGISIFKGVCIFNLSTTCKHMSCNFHHKNIEVNFVKSKLQAMSEEMFIRETMYLFKWPVLKLKYGMCFINECIRRNLTIWLLQMVKHLITKTNLKHRDSADFAIEMIEATLLHLNDVDIEPCADLLRSKTTPKSCMCDDFMKVISETQNFSRFKDVFIKLTSFMCEIGRSFRLDVATQVLERLCILPYDEALARTLMNIIEKTNPNIFKTPMMGLLENQLSKNNAGLYEKLMSLKLQLNQGVTTPPTQSPRIAHSNAGYMTSTPRPRADSPDTTNMDSTNNASEPVITRTITINRTINTININRNISSDSSKEPAKRYEHQKLEVPAKRYEPQKPEQAWWKYPPSYPSMRPQRQAYKQLGFFPRAFAGTPPKFRRKRPH